MNTNEEIVVSDKILKQQKKLSANKKDLPSTTTTFKKHGDGRVVVNQLSLL